MQKKLPYFKRDIQSAAVNDVQKSKNSHISKEIYNLWNDNNEEIGRYRRSVTFIINLYWIQTVSIRTEAIEIKNIKLIQECDGDIHYSFLSNML